MTADTITAADIRINARWLIPIEPAGTVLEHYAVIIQGDRLAAVIPQEQADRSFRTRETVDLPNHVVMPGLGHMTAIEDPEGTLRELLDFLGDVGS